MAGNKKTTRKSAGIRSTLRTQGYAIPIIRAFNPAGELKKLSDIALKSLNEIINQTGNFADWMNVLHRLYIGSVAVETYFNMDETVIAIFNKASLAIEIVKLRTHQTDVFGILLHELDSVTAALALTDEASRSMSVEEIHKVHLTVEVFFTEMHKQNAIAAGKGASEKEVMLETLRAEYNQVKGERVERDVSYYAFEEKVLEAA